jgi:hypothetical protein
MSATSPISTSCNSPKTESTSIINQHKSLKSVTISPYEHIYFQKSHIFSQ